MVLIASAEPGRQAGEIVVQTVARGGEAQAWVHERPPRRVDREPLVRELVKR